MIRPACSPEPGPALSGASPLLPDPATLRAPHARAPPARAALLLAALALPAMALALPATTFAQDDAGTTTEDNPVVIRFTAGAPDPIGIDACASAIGDTRLVDLTEYSDTTDARDPNYRLYYYLGSEPCFVGDGVSDCPGTGEDDDGELCGCHAQGTMQSFSFQLDELSGVGDICGADGPDSISFVGEVVYLADGDASELVYQGTEAVTIVFDRVRPGRPEAPPRLSPVEAALLVRADTVTDAARYEVCVRPYDGTTGLSPATGTNEELRGSFATATCRSTETIGGDGYRFSGLQNYVNYEVIYAAIDEAGNRGPNSASEVATPVPQLDFAELYNSRLGGQKGEEGGCSTAPGRSPGPGSTLLFILGCAALVTRAHRALHGDRS